ncbi:hypothetical protein R4Z09_10815 [Niallia oryzisoli]|uniref:Uncharacterized protein n=1 Tax=Niallia oryzisoli TaxID=1737571 RepID=A0ABZ2CK72_9BACI
MRYNQNKRNGRTKRNDRGTRKPRQLNKNGIRMDNDRPPKVFRVADKDE